MSRLRVVAPGDSSVEVPMAQGVESVVKECLADNPAVVFIAWEAGTKVTVRTLPDSVMVQKGFIGTLYDVLFNDESADGLVE